MLDGLPFTLQSLHTVHNSKITLKSDNSDSLSVCSMYLLGGHCSLFGVASVSFPHRLNNEDIDVICVWTARNVKYER